jgi:hypothetical protein
VKEMQFLGLVINSKGIKPDESKIANIVNMPISKNKKELEVLLGSPTLVPKINYSLEFEFLWKKRFSCCV